MKRKMQFIKTFNITIYKLSEKQGVEKPRSFVYSSERFAAATVTDCMYKEFHVIIGIVFEGQSMNFTSVALCLAL